MDERPSLVSLIPAHIFVISVIIAITYYTGDQEFKDHFKEHAVAAFNHIYEHREAYVIAVGQNLAWLGKACFQGALNGLEALIHFVRHPTFNGLVDIAAGLFSASKYTFEAAWGMFLTITFAMFAMLGKGATSCIFVVIAGWLLEFMDRAEEAVLPHGWSIDRMMRDDWSLVRETATSVMEKFGG